MAELLLEMGADVETPDNYGQSPFFMACWKGHSEVAALLLDFEANKDCRTKTGITPLFQVEKGWGKGEGGRGRVSCIHWLPAYWCCSVGLSDKLRDTEYSTREGLEPMMFYQLSY